MMVTLSYAETLSAAMVGAMRQIDNLKKGGVDKYGAEDESSWQYDIIGALGEMGVAKMLDLYWWGAISNYSAADVGAFQVRATAWRGGRLLLHKPPEAGKRGDDPDSAYILARVFGREITAAGWVYGREGQVDLYWGSLPGKKRPCFIAPNEILRPMDSFPR